MSSSNWLSPARYLLTAQIRKLDSSTTIFSLPFARGGVVPFGGRSVRSLLPHFAPPRSPLPRESASLTRGHLADGHQAPRRLSLARSVAPARPGHARDPHRPRTRQAHCPVRPGARNVHGPVRRRCVSSRCVLLCSVSSSSSSRPADPRERAHTQPSPTPSSTSPSAACTSGRRSARSRPTMPCLSTARTRPTPLRRRRAERSGARVSSRATSTRCGRRRAFRLESSSACTRAGLTRLDAW